MNYGCNIILCTPHQKHFCLHAPSYGRRKGGVAQLSHYLKDRVITDHALMLLISHINGLIQTSSMEGHTNPQKYLVISKVPFTLHNNEKQIAICGEGRKTLAKKVSTNFCLGRLLMQRCLSCILFPYSICGQNIRNLPKIINLSRCYLCCISIIIYWPPN